MSARSLCANLGTALHVGNRSLVGPGTCGRGVVREVTANVNTGDGNAAGD